MFKTLVFEYRIVSFEYFTEQLSISQAYLIIENLKWIDFSFRTIMRYQIWSLYNSNAFGKNKNEIADIMPLPWDDRNETHRVASDEELEKQKAYMKQMEEMIKNNSTTTEKFMG